MAAVFFDEVKDLPAQLLDFQLDRRDVTHDMRLVLVRYWLEAYGTLSAKQCSIRILLVSSSDWQAGNRKRRLQPLAVADGKGWSLRLRCGGKGWSLRLRCCSNFRLRTP